MRFQGGPYDGRDFPIQPPLAKIMRLPPEKDLAAFFQIAEVDPGATGLQEWPYLYELDADAEPPVYRFSDS
ncbi:MAG TPA: hypothetical protein VMM76_25585 [Pirellulaceae bacterium]|nr:hypothetical protein [Pirellulaceae bacterium]